MKLTEITKLKFSFWAVFALYLLTLFLLVALMIATRRYEVARNDAWHWFNEAQKHAQ